MKLSKVVITILLSLLILFSTFRISLTFAYYYLDTADFVERFCENIDKPELKCNGKCHLKKVAKNTNSSSESPAIIVDFKEIILFVEYQKEYLFCACQKENKQLFYYSNLYTFNNNNLLDKPPQI